MKNVSQMFADRIAHAMTADKQALIGINPGENCDHYNEWPSASHLLEISFPMNKNMGYADRSFRVILATIFIGLFAFNDLTQAAGFVLIGIAAVFLTTAFVGYCPLYRLFGINTRVGTV